MSATLQNIISALNTMVELGKYPTRQEQSSFYFLSNAQTIDQARNTFFRDAESQRIFDWCCQNRILASAFGAEIHDDLPNPLYSKDTWKALEEKALNMADGFAQGDYLLDRIDTWLLEAYSLKGHCEVREDNVVLDCGSFTGNTSMYFSQKTGPGGHVYAFEPDPATFAQLKTNVRPFSNITPLQCALADKSGSASFAANAGAGARLSHDGGATVYCLSIDEFVRKQKLQRVDFIKMDIEGAEEAAIRGAKTTIQKNRPMMALSAYHRELDIVTLPSRISKILPEYSFRLRHFSPTMWETVLYCYLPEHIERI